ncbi:RdgB/HAM1 family non-canonical purine NTP pyrophosphatase [Oligella urethralis]|uniref:dITP/XTP pyrophosphatase n=1 Tax=Oligella urethralis TaxID=90245 RepID=A0A2X1UVS4_9BURK|nr:RdgB/HAM1 family non-canonical purine NTP pyrophosphatase [Oligella urethralis]SPY08481.1 Non-canonical purine NTP pyrophosphatase [Oligella urethralis]SUA58745.1 Non-canonical purine NTP pyrophosphatase [Oligella urethralis]
MSLLTTLDEIVLASNNQGKLKEFVALFNQYGISIRTQGEFNVAECDEPFHTFLENALAKARHASKETGLAAIADDSGIVVPALKGFPGVMSARYATLFGEPKSDANNNACLIRQLQAHSDKSAAYLAVLVFVRHADDPAPLVAQSWWHGVIVEEPRGANGFGYDPHFYLPDYGLTAAEMEPALKNSLSHRAAALKKLIAEMEEAQQ